MLASIMTQSKSTSNVYGHSDNDIGSNSNGNNNNYNNSYGIGSPDTYTNNTYNGSPGLNSYKKSGNSRRFNNLSKRTMNSSVKSSTSVTTTASILPKHRRTSSFDRTLNKSKSQPNNNNDENGNPLPPPKIPKYVNLQKGISKPGHGDRKNKAQSTVITSKARVRKRHSLSSNGSQHSKNDSGGGGVGYDQSGLSIQNRLKNFKASFDDIKVNELDVCGTEALMAQMNDGTECLRFFSEALSTFATQQKKQANAMLKLFEKSKKRYAQMEGMPNFTFTMELVHQLLEETVRRESEFASFLDSSCIPMIHKLEKDCEREWQRIHTQSKKELKSIQQTKNNLIKLQKQTKNAISSVQKARLNQQKESKNSGMNSAGSGLGAGKANFKKMINNVQSKAGGVSGLSVGGLGGLGGGGGSELDVSYDKAKKMDKQLKSSIIEYGKARDMYVNKQNRNKQDIVNMEHCRVGTMLQVFRQMASKQENVMNNKTITELQSDILVKTSQMDAKYEVQKFVQECVERHGRWEPAVPPVTQFYQNVNSKEFEYRDMFYSVDDAIRFVCICVYLLYF